MKMRSIHCKELDPKNLLLNAGARRLSWYCLRAEMLDRIEERRAVRERRPAYINEKEAVRLEGCLKEETDKGTRVYTPISVITLLGGFGAFASVLHALGRVTSGTALWKNVALHIGTLAAIGLVYKAGDWLSENLSTDAEIKELKMKLKALMIPERNDE